MGLQLHARDSEKALGTGTGQLQRRQDREQREDEADVEYNEQDHLPDWPHTGADDRRDCREVGKRGR